MILHCTQKLAARLPSSILISDPASGDSNREQGPLASWHAHLLNLDRRQCVLFCHDATRFVLFLPGLRAPQLADLGRWHRDLFLAVLEAQGLETSLLARVGLMLGPLGVDRETDRSVLGSMREAAQDLEFGALDRAANVMELDPIATSRWLNERPVTAHGQCLWPERAMQELVRKL